MTLQQFGTVVFAGLSIFFFSQARKAKKKKPNSKERKVKGFISGLLYSSLNMFAIPFYFGVTSTLVMMHWYEFNMMNNMIFVIGSALGTFTLLFLYSQLARKIEKKIERLANQMDLNHGIVTGLIVIINLADFLL
jgi:threonine/homoserine/homoserine lactone efflux protein